MKPIFGTTVGQKSLVSVTGLILYGFVVMHMLGNLKAFMGVDPITGQHKLDHYAHFLREIGSDLFGHSTVLWISRAVLLTAIVIHVVLVVRLSLLNRKARPVGYHLKVHDSATVASRSMLIGGMGIAAFIVYHLLHLTFGTVHPQFIEGLVFHNVSSTFQSVTITGVYTAAVALLGFHLYHGVWSLFQTLGLNNSSYNFHLRMLAKASGLIIFLGFAAVPLAIYFGFIGR